ncbi:TspO/MBR family protein [Armatimonas sp.]|uniref:TspO/MBR family protein n=1 Tax=Armatimonas sp. TaxID=1872638 RepID=UPI0037528B2B
MTPPGAVPPAPHPALPLLGWLTLCFSASLGAVFVSSDRWYAGLVKPSWNPPAWVFGPIWTLLYMLMAVSAWLIWHKGGWKTQWRALSWFLVQLLLNAFWTPLFFGRHLLGLAFAEILVLWLALAVTLGLFWRIRKVAAVLLIPYLIWVSIAATLNLAIWRLNP